MEKLNNFIINLKSALSKLHNEIPKMEIISEEITNILQSENGKIYLLATGQTAHMINKLVESFKYLFKFDEDRIVPIIIGMNHEEAININDLRSIESEQSIAAIDALELNLSSNDMIINFTSTEETPYANNMLKSANDLGAKIAIVSSSETSNHSHVEVDYYIHVPLKSKVIENLYIGNHTTILKTALEFIMFKSFENLGQIVDKKVMTTKMWTKRLLETSYESIHDFDSEMTFDEFVSLSEKCEYEFSVVIICLIKSLEPGEAKKLLEKRKYNFKKILK